MGLQDKIITSVSSKALNFSSIKNIDGGICVLALPY